MSDVLRRFEPNTHSRLQVVTNRKSLTCLLKQPGTTPKNEAAGAGVRANSDQAAPLNSIVIASGSEAISGRRALDRSRLLRRASALRNDSANLVENCSSDRARRLIPLLRLAVPTSGSGAPL